MHDFSFFFSSCLRRSALFFIFLWVRVTKARPTPRDGCGVNNMPHPVFLPPSLFLSLGLCWVRKCVFGGDGGGGVGTQAVCLGSPLVGEERDRRRKESPVCSFTLPVTQQNFREDFFFFVNNPPLLVAARFAPYPLCPPFFFFRTPPPPLPSSLNIIVCVSLLNCFCM